MAAGFASVGLEKFLVGAIGTDGAGACGDGDMSIAVVEIAVCSTCLGNSRATPSMVTEVTGGLNSSCIGVRIATEGGSVRPGT